MKKFLLLALFFPFLGIAQTTTVKKPADGFLIAGNVTGYPDGTSVQLLNANSGQPEASGQMLKGKFTLTGKLMVPDYKVIAFNNQAPYITLFLDNSSVKITAKKEALELATVKGSPSNDQFTTFNNITKPYQKLFAQEGSFDSATIKSAAQVLEKFVRAHTNSYVTPLAIYRHNQVTLDNDKMEELYNLLDADVKVSPIGSYVAQQIADAKKNPLGKLLPDFTQADTSGREIALSSFKGKYVLVDFWASWCGPCRQENPNVVSVYNKFKGKNFTVLGVSLDKLKQPWIDAIKMDQLAWTHVSDLKGWGNAVAQQFQIQSIPQNFLLDPSGKVIAKNLRGAALESKLSSVIK